MNMKIPAFCQNYGVPLDRSKLKPLVVPLIDTELYQIKKASKKKGKKK